VDAADAEQYPKLRLILSRAINWDLIRQQYDQMVKYATALRLGTAETEAILRRFTRTGLQRAAGFIEQINITELPPLVSHMEPTNLGPDMGMLHP
jgi:hypothetical protein